MPNCWASRKSPAATWPACAIPACCAKAARAKPSVSRKSGTCTRVTTRAGCSPASSRFRWITPADFLYGARFLLGPRAVSIDEEGTLRGAFCVSGGGAGRRRAVTVGPAGIRARARALLSRPAARRERPNPLNSRLVGAPVGSPLPAYLVTHAAIASGVLSQCTECVPAQRLVAARALGRRPAQPACREVAAFPHRPRASGLHHRKHGLAARV